MKLNLTATTTEEKVLKEYLEQTVSKVLADKINNGFPVEKDGKKLVSRKTLAGFMKYATDEARKQAAKGEREFFVTTCSQCGGEAKVPFKPRDDRAVLCSECFAKSRA